MRRYNVMEIAKLLNINTETVRRWIRSGKLRSTQSSKKKGNIVDEHDLFEFARTIPKYRKMLGLSEIQIDDTYFETLNSLLIELITKRDALNEQINKIQKILKES